MLMKIPKTDKTRNLYGMISLVKALSYRELYGSAEFVRHVFVNRHEKLQSLYGNSFILPSLITFASVISNLSFSVPEDLFVHALHGTGHVAV